MKQMHLSNQDIFRELKEMLKLYTINIGMSLEKTKRELIVSYEREFAAKSLFQTYDEYSICEKELMDTISSAISDYYIKLNLIGASCMIQM